MFKNQSWGKQWNQQTTKNNKTPTAKARWERQMQDYFGEDWDGLKLEVGEEMVG